MLRRAHCSLIHALEEVGIALEDGFLCATISIGHRALLWGGMRDDHAISFTGGRTRYVSKVC